MGRAPCCEKVGLNRGAWTVEEDIILVSFIQKHGHANWRALPKQAGLLRCGKSCRLRWINYLRPDIKRGNFTGEEEETIIRLHGLLGNKWSKIASSLPGRTDNEIKNVWNTHIKKRLMPKECYSSVKETKQQPSSPRSSSSMSSGDQNDNGEHDEPLEHEQKLDMEDNHDALNKITENYTELNSVTTKDIAMLDIQLDPWVVSEMTTPSLSSNSAESFVGSSNLLADYEVDQVSLLQELDIPIEPEFWSLINDDSLLQNPDVGPSVEDGGHENPTISEDGERQRWVAYLEQELEL